MKALQHCAVFGLLALGACTTTYVAPPPLAPATLPPGALQIKNDQIDTEPRIYFSDGITTLTTHYSGWTDALARSLRDRLAPLKVNDSARKALSLSIQAITCTGHYVPDCTVAAVVATAAGYRRAINGATYTGYPLASAMDKAVNGVAASIAADPEVISYLIR